METRELAASMEVAQARGGIVGAQYNAVAEGGLGGLQAQLSDIARAMSDDAPIAEAMKGSAADKMMQDLSAYAASLSGEDGQPAPEAPAGGGSVTYELFLERGSGGVASDRVADLERRLAKLEQVTGAAGSELPTDISTAVAQLKEKVSLLDKNALARLAQTAQEAKRNLEAARDAKSKLSKDQSEQIATVAEAVKKWMPMSEELPMIVERLYQLKSVHSQAAEYVNAVKDITAEQKAIGGGLKEQEKVLKQLQSSLQENVKTMAANMKALEARCEKLKK